LDTSPKPNKKLGEMTKVDFLAEAEIIGVILSFAYCLAKLNSVARSSIMNVLLFVFHKLDGNLLILCIDTQSHDTHRIPW
jgi:hypothetical protein